MSVRNIYYSDKYHDDEYEYRHVTVPKEVAKLVPKNHLMSETEWRSIGIQQSQGWIHYMKHEPEPNVILFRRPLSEEQKRQIRLEMKALQKENHCPQDHAQVIRQKNA